MTAAQIRMTSTNQVVRRGNVIAKHRKRIADYEKLLARAYVLLSTVIDDAGRAKWFHPAETDFPEPELLSEARELLRSIKNHVQA